MLLVSNEHDVQSKRFEFLLHSFPHFTLGRSIKNVDDNEVPNLEDDLLNELSDDDIKTVLETINILRKARLDLKDVRDRNVGFPFSVLFKMLPLLGF